MQVVRKQTEYPCYNASIVEILHTRLMLEPQSHWIERFLDHVIDYAKILIFFCCDCSRAIIT